jgi:DNA-directed RNA polymerase subunit RPC12/RpoP
MAKILREKCLEIPPGREICSDCGREMVWDDPRRNMPVLVCPACLYRSVRKMEREVHRLKAVRR